MNEIKLTMLEKINLILKIVIGSAISWELAILFGSTYPYLGPIALILCIKATLIKESMGTKFFLIRIPLRNWNEGKAMIEVILNETRSNEKFYFPAIWNAQHFISTLKQYPRPIT
ncbi:hypothetical protein [Bacillus sp. EB600]|uniref:hypothetical protein n=1 Tax=Bacillus sp. EB600 TaxID=2806345 RepID=UPI00210EAC01|nr:hypothetical protein [Bacillus sp. EB600]MCQ6281114.1 hypothetical protein [Bacillus sp. EB600]